MATLPAYAVLLLSLPFLAAAQSSPAAAPGPAGPPNPVAILTEAREFGTLLKLLTEAMLVEAIGTQLNSEKGITIFAPKDSAFVKISSVLGTLKQDQKTVILMYHVLPEYVSFMDLAALSNPVKTLASGLTLNFTGGNGQANVSTGAVKTMVGRPLYDMAPLAIFPLDDVLVPPPAASAPAAGPAGAKGPSTAPRPSGAGLERRVGWGAVSAALVAALTFF